MESRGLIDAIMRQTTLLIAQLATSTGIRAPLANLADQVFLELSREIEQQGVTRKVAADMLLFALCTDTDGVRLHLFDQQGVRVTEPTLIDASDDVVFPSGCSLAWSGSELLAVWSRSASASGLPTPGFDTAVGTVHAKVIPLLAP